MKTGIYIHSTSKTKYAGVERKISNQIKAFSNHYTIIELLLEKEKTNIIKSIIWRLPFGSYGKNYEKLLKEIKSIKDYDFIYIRDNAWDRRYYMFFGALRRINRKAKIIAELPTYPYSKELLSSFSMWPYYIKDKIYRRYTNKFVDRIVTFSEDNEIFKVPTIKVLNGIDVDEVEYCTEENDSTIDFIAVASMRRVHGYERIIKGLRDYISQGNSRSVYFHFVGDGPRIHYYKRLVKKYNLDDYVCFYGNKTGAELEKIYKKADIGLGSFRFDLISSNLKVREYLAHGLPFVSSCVEDVIIKYPECKYYKGFPNDNSTIPIHDLIMFYDELHGDSIYDSNVIRRAIHDFAKRTVDMEATLKPVYRFIEDCRSVK